MFFFFFCFLLLQWYLSFLCFYGRTGGLGVIFILFMASRYHFLNFCKVIPGGWRLQGMVLGWNEGLGALPNKGITIGRL